MTMKKIYLLSAAVCSFFIPVIQASDAASVLELIAAAASNNGNNGSNKNVNSGGSSENVNSGPTYSLLATGQEYDGVGYAVGFSDGTNADIRISSAHLALVNAALGSDNVTVNVLTTKNSSGVWYATITTSTPSSLTPISSETIPLMNWYGQFFGIGYTPTAAIASSANPTSGGFYYKLSDGVDWTYSPISGATANQSFVIKSTNSNQGTSETLSILQPGQTFSQLAVYFGFVNGSENMTSYVLLTQDEVNQINQALGSGIVPGNDVTFNATLIENSNNNWSVTITMLVDSSVLFTTGYISLSSFAGGITPSGTPSGTIPATATNTSCGISYQLVGGSWQNSSPVPFSPTIGGTIQAPNFMNTLYSGTPSYSLPGIDNMYLGQSLKSMKVDLTFESGDTYIASLSNKTLKKIKSLLPTTDIILSFVLTPNGSGLNLTLEVFNATTNALVTYQEFSSIADMKTNAAILNTDTLTATNISFKRTAGATGSNATADSTSQKLVGSTDFLQSFIIPKAIGSNQAIIYGGPSISSLPSVFTMGTGQSLSSFSFNYVISGTEYLNIPISETDLLTINSYMQSKPTASVVAELSVTQSGDSYKATVSSFDPVTGSLVSGPSRVRGLSPVTGSAVNSIVIERSAGTLAQADMQPQTFATGDTGTIQYVLIPAITEDYPWTIANPISISGVPLFGLKYSVKFKNGDQFHYRIALLNLRAINSALTNSNNVTMNIKIESADTSTYKVIISYSLETPDAGITFAPDIFSRKLRGTAISTSNNILDSSVTPLANGVPQVPYSLGTTSQYISVTLKA